MGKAAYCTGCRAYQWIREDGSCMAGHAPEFVGQVYEADGGPDLAPVKPKKQALPNWLIAVLVIGALLWTANVVFDETDMKVDSTTGMIMPQPEPEPSLPAGTYAAGVYLVGEDIEAGRYKGAPTGDIEAYWAVLGDANGEDIIANGNAPGQFYVDVEDGQYLEVKRATVTLVE